MATLTLNKWGNAQAVRLPKELRERVGMADGSRVEATVKDGAIVLRPITDVRIIRVPKLSDLLHGRQKPYEAEEDAFGSTVGDEAL